MVGTVLLCVISTVMFCMCARGLMAVSTGPKGWIPIQMGPFSASARRLARHYVVFAFFILMVVSLVSAISSFVELFSL